MSEDEQFEARMVAGGMPTSCCDYGVVSLTRGVEVCRVWEEEDARAIARLLNERTRPAPKADGLAHHAGTLRMVKDVLANGAHFADDPECHPLYPNYVVAVDTILAALKDRDVVLEEAAERAAFVAGYRAAHMVPDAYDSTSAAEEAWEG